MVDLSGVLPGWRGTDPDGGTWVLTPDADYRPWHYLNQDGYSETWRSQEEAEAAGLVPLVSQNSARDAEFYRLGYEGGRLAAAVTAPAPLDPGNPDLRAVVEALQVLGRRWPDHGILRNARTFLAAEADRLDRERAEAEQDASDRKRAEEIADQHGVIDIDGAMDLVLAGIRDERERAGRAERQEAAK